METGKQASAAAQQLPDSGLRNSSACGRRNRRLWFCGWFRWWGWWGWWWLRLRVRLGLRRIARSARQIDKFPVLVTRRIAERVVTFRETSPFDRLLRRQAIDSGNANPGLPDQSPLGTACHRVEKDFAQMPLDHGETIVHQQFLQSIRIALGYSRRTFVVRPDRLPELVAHEHQFFFLVPPCFGAPYQSCASQRDAGQRDRKQHPDISEAPRPAHPAAYPACWPAGCHHVSYNVPSFAVSAEPLRTS